MIRIGIDRSFHEIYEGSGSIWRAVQPTPMTSFAKIDPQVPISEVFGGHDDPVFREDAFDAVTRVRRGRLYSPEGMGEQAVLPHPLYGVLGSFAGPTPDGMANRILHFYSQFLFIESRPKIVALGSPDSLWRVLACELITTGEYLLTLKARGAFGILPEIDPVAVPEVGRTKAIETLQILVDAAHREAPGSIVDRARDAAQWCLATWLASERTDSSLLSADLGELIRKIKRDPDMSKRAFWHSVEIIRVLHARGKPNEQENHNLRPVMEDDAELALRAIGFLIREFRWAKID